MISGISERNRKLLDDLARLRKGPFSVIDAASTLNLSEEKTRVTLAYLVRKGWLSRVKRGLYISVPLGTVNPQEYKEHPWVVANRVFEPYYIGGWSAAEHWEFTDQIFNSVVIITLRKFKTTSMTIQGTDYIVKTVREKYFGKAKSVWLENIKIAVADPLQTVVDILDDPYIGGGIRTIADIVHEYFSSSHRNDDELLKYVEHKNNKTIYKRLGFIVDALGLDAEILKTACKERKSAGYSLLDPAVGAKGSYDSRWNLRINVRVER
jgi:predicted transcriptional regulator of viral defense system